MYIPLRRWLCTYWLISEHAHIVIFFFLSFQKTMCNGFTLCSFFLHVDALCTLFDLCPCLCLCVIVSVYSLNTCPVATCLYFLVSNQNEACAYSRVQKPMCASRRRELPRDSLHGMRVFIEAGGHEVVNITEWRRAYVTDTRDHTARPLYRTEDIDCLVLHWH